MQGPHQVWGASGIPDGNRFLRLLYNRVADVLIVVAQTELGTVPVKRLYFRPVTEPSYHPVPVQDSLEIQEDPASSETAAYLIYNEMRLRPPQPGFSEVGADWVSVRRFSFETMVSEIVLDRPGLRPPPPYLSGWVSGILAVWPDGTGAVCSVGFKKTAGNGGFVVDYFVYDVSFKDGLRRQITALPQVFF
jgi:hypothetical protein